MQILIKSFVEVIDVYVDWQMVSDNVFNVLHVSKNAK